MWPPAVWISPRRTVTEWRKGCAIISVTMRECVSLIIPLLISGAALVCFLAAPLPRSVTLAIVILVLDHAASLLWSVLPFLSGSFARAIPFAGPSFLLVSRFQA